MLLPKVSIICVVYNQAKTLEETIQSVYNQKYPLQQIELVVIDDGSIDSSNEKIKSLKKSFQFQYIKHETNKGYCKTFNEGLALATGEYILDLAADDTLEENFISVSVQQLMQTNDEFAAHYCNAYLINDDNPKKEIHSETTNYKPRPSGDIYAQLIENYFICSPTVLFKKKHLLELGGYDENLLYEDFDIQIRLARSFKFIYTNQVLLTKRISNENMSKQQKKWKSKYQRSTFIVCKKIYQLNKTKAEFSALRNRCLYEAKHNFFIGNLKLTFEYLFLCLKANFKT